MVDYTYDPWGVPTVTGDAELAELNPCTYRGYDYDEETGYYYLQSRYYDPEIGRFLNMDETDILMISNGNLLINNMFSYCNNCPIMNLDTTGNIPVSVLYAAAGAALFGGVTYLIGKMLGISGSSLAKLTASLALLGAAAAAVLGVKFLAKVAPKLAKWFNTVAKKTKILPPNISKDETRTLSLGGIVIFDAFKLMFHPADSHHSFFHIQIEVKVPGIGKNG